MRSASKFSQMIDSGLQYMRAISTAVFIVISIHWNHAVAQCNFNAGADITICAGQSITLGGNPVLGNGFGNNPDFEWSNGETNDLTPTVSPNATTTYTLDVENSGACIFGNYSDQVTLTVISAALSGD